MKTNTVETIIEDFRKGQNIFRRPSVELMVCEISRLCKENEKLQLRLAAAENDILLYEVNKILKRTQSDVQELEEEKRAGWKEWLEKLQLTWKVEDEPLKQRIAELETEQRWIPVSERLPECGEIVNWSHKSWTRIKEGYMTGSGILKVWGGEYQKLDKMNWRPLPHPPKDGE